jgi:uroporphyrinogen-III decarboxylase
MTRRERLMATLRGEPVDRPAVNFYEIGGFQVDPSDLSPFNIYSAPDWKPLLELAEDKTDLIRMCGPNRRPVDPELVARLQQTETVIENGSQFHRTTIRVDGHTLTSLHRRDPGVNTVWTLEHLLKSADDVNAYLRLPDAYFAHTIDVSPMEARDRSTGDAGIAMSDTGDPMCVAAGMFGMEDYTVLAMTEPGLFHRLLEKLAAPLWRDTEAIASLFPGHLWRICGPEYASEPYLPPSLFSEFVCRYTEPMVRAIQRHGGFARIHCHGRLSHILPLIAGMGADGLDPIEPPPQGDVRLLDVRREYGKQMVLFGNIEASDIELLPPREFELKVRTALEEGTAGEGRGFVLMPSASPYGRTLTPHTLENYRTMVRLAEAFT